MKLKNQGIILLVLPLVCQLIFVGALNSSLVNLDNAATREADAKKIVSTLQEIRGRILEVWLMCIAHQYYNSSTTLSKSASLKRLITNRLRVLRSLVKENPEATEVLGEYSKLVERFDILVPACVAERVEGLDEFKMEWMSLVRQVVFQEAKLFNLYRPTLREFSSKASADRHNLFFLVVLALTVNSLIVVSLAVILTITTNARLKLLMENIERFSVGELQLQKVGGSDELSELDSEFRAMAQTRSEAEELQNSLYAMISHDLRSPLTALSMTASTIIEFESDSLNPGLRFKLNKMRSVIDSLVTFAQSILDLEKSKTGSIELNYKTCSAKAMIDTSIDTVKAIADQKEVTINSRVCHLSHDGRLMASDAPDSDMVCDESRLIQVLINLLSSAIDRSPTGSVIDVFTTIQPEVLCRFQVKDQGLCFTDEERENLFVHSSELVTKRDFGLGLSICKLLVEAHNGKLGLECTGVEGNIFWFELPQTPPQGQTP
ncbi:MAG: HAMP domain-containing histidine kinase [Cyanobacteria bacterium]|nr:HAMP domain-containing histidine kinase [Cyanobacteriota bacterium]